MSKIHSFMHELKLRQCLNFTFIPIPNPNPLLIETGGAPGGQKWN